MSDKRSDVSYWEPFGSTKVYGETKCAQICFAKHLQKLLNDEKDADNVSIGSYLWVTSLHPGYINSGFYRPSEFPCVVRFIWSLLYPFQVTFAMITPKQGAQTSLHCALSDENVQPGGYHGRCEIQDVAPQTKELVDKYPERLYNVSKEIWPIEYNGNGAAGAAASV